uniref:EF-hand domain-containing protein n=1 Tax=Timema tahoe TaxID=61484 RepID=A0A7R9IN16_9NEOP|nr:unnamed protein product [Timema tahoe]
MSASAPVHQRVGGGTMLIKSVSIFLASGRKASVAGKSRTTAAGVGDGSTSGGGKRKGGKARRMMGDDTTKMSTVTKCSPKMIESLKKRTHFTSWFDNQTWGRDVFLGKAELNAPEFGSEIVRLVTRLLRLASCNPTRFHHPCFSFHASVCLEMSSREVLAAGVAAAIVILRREKKRKCREFWMSQFLESRFTRTLPSEMPYPSYLIETLAYDTNSGFTFKPASHSLCKTIIRWDLCSLKDLLQEIEALCHVYRKLVSNNSLNITSVSGSVTTGAVTATSTGMSPSVSVYEGLDRIVFRDLLHNTFDLVTEEVLMDRIFCAFDRCNLGVIRLEEWVTGLSVFLRGTFEERTTFCFLVYDLNSDGFISRDEMFHLLRFCAIKYACYNDFKSAVHCCGAESGGADYLVPY